MLGAGAFFFSASTLARRASIRLTTRSGGAPGAASVQPPILQHIHRAKFDRMKRIRRKPFEWRTFFFVFIVFGTPSTRRFPLREAARELSGRSFADS